MNSADYYIESRKSGGRGEKNSISLGVRLGRTLTLYLLHTKVLRFLILGVDFP